MYYPADRKIIPELSLLGRYAAACRDDSRANIVLTFGAFDILHPGHLRYLEHARSLGDALMVGITSDVAIRCVKGPTRPVNPEADRAFVVAGFACVDHVFIFDGNDCEVIRIVQPKVCVYSETSEKQMAERGEEQRLVESYGGKILCLPAQSNRHSSDIIRLLVKEMGGN